MIEHLKTLGASEETANKIYDGDGRFDVVARTLVPQAQNLCLIEDQGRIINKLQSLSKGQEKLAKSSERQEKLAKKAIRQSWAIIAGTVIIIILTIAGLVVALHWL
jgi:hypothetical protein